MFLSSTFFHAFLEFLDLFDFDLVTSLETIRVLERVDSQIDDCQKEQLEYGRHLDIA